MDADIKTCSLKSVVKCCDCGCNCSLKSSSSNNEVWIRSVKRKHDEFERSSRFHIPGLDVLPIAKVGIENECNLLREMVSNQQGTIQELCLELEEERDASSSAANEAMSMILRLQREKAEVQMEARQFKRFAEEKMSHDSQEIAAIEESLYKKEQEIQSLTCEIQAYKHRIMSFGLTESEAETDNINNLCVYPQLRCNLHTHQAQLEVEYDAIDVETPKSAQDLRNFEFRSSPRAHDEKFIIGHSPTQIRHSRFSIDYNSSSSQFGAESVIDSPRWGCNSFKKLDCVVEELRKYDSINGSEYEDEMSDRIYTIDSIHPGVPYSEPKVGAKIFDEYVSTPMGSSKNHNDLHDPEVKKLYLRLQALEADRESMRQTILSMQTDKAQVVLLREIAQHLCKDMTPTTKTTPQMCVQTSTASTFFSVSAVVKWIGSLVFRKNKARRSKYLDVLANSNPGLLMLLDTSPHTKLWRCVLSTQISE